MYIMFNLECLLFGHLYHINKREEYKWMCIRNQEQVMIETIPLSCDRCNKRFKVNAAAN